ncbi:MAG: hypothetical protein IPK50_20930 [Fibrobacterota bacterium]|nr:hypothetical protein [Fibrobacterota bacterium]QQS04716.1 MAG: hypothetical protein IPK50_20930 [Fibrobacterota bacterium]
MHVSDFIKENIYLPYFRRHSSRARSQQIVLGVAIGALVIAASVGLFLWLRRRRSKGCCGGVAPEATQIAD